MARPRFGEGGLALEPSKSVFINCPLDAGYAPLFEAIVFATVCCGFLPRSALESGTVSEPRLARITRADATPAVTPREVLELLPSFQLRRRELDTAWGGYPPWVDVITTAIEVASLL